mmetsp:Transcript_30817/g.70688  ORF Transcript_30817/g.70688 Transcript_30817/m.70688 type:complete len:155 (+) Transcript_30817:651-1115(+)
MTQVAAAALASAAQQRHKAVGLEVLELEKTAAEVPVVDTAAMDTVAVAAEAELHIENLDSQAWGVEAAAVGVALAYMVPVDMDRALASFGKAGMNSPLIQAAHQAAAASRLAASPDSNRLEELVVLVAWCCRQDPGAFLAVHMHQGKPGQAVVA